jgi:hypothetical protein
MAADGLTKPLPLAKIKDFEAHLGLRHLKEVGAGDTEGAGDVTSRTIRESILPTWIPSIPPRAEV